MWHGLFGLGVTALCPLLCLSRNLPVAFLSVGGVCSGAVSMAIVRSDQGGVFTSSLHVRIGMQSPRWVGPGVNLRPCAAFEQGCCQDWHRQETQVCPLPGLEDRESWYWRLRSGGHYRPSLSNGNALSLACLHSPLFVEGAGLRVAGRGIDGRTKCRSAPGTEPFIFDETLAVEDTCPGCRGRGDSSISSSISGPVRHKVVR